VQISRQVIGLIFVWRGTAAELPLAGLLKAYGRFPARFQAAIFAKVPF